MNNILRLETYGKINPLMKSYHDIKNAFRVNRLSEALLFRKGLKPYQPKIKKHRVAIGCLVMLVLISTPFTPEFLIAPFLIGWILK